MGQLETWVRQNRFLAGVLAGALLGLALLTLYTALDDADDGGDADDGDGGEPVEQGEPPAGDDAGEYDPGVASDITAAGGAGDNSAGLPSHLDIVTVGASETGKAGRNHHA